MYVFLINVERPEKIELAFISLMSLELDTVQYPTIMQLS